MEAIEVWNQVWEKCNSVKPEDLSHSEQTIYHVSRFLIEIENKGLSGFLYNISPNWQNLTSLKKELERIECFKAATEVRQLFTIVPGPPESNEAETWGGFLALADPDKSIDRIE